jgi:ethylbenzene dioxygenase alpha subunit
MTLAASSYIDLDKGWVDRRIFWEREIYERELEQIFARCWLFVAHESQVEKPGDFIITSIGEDGVIVARGQDRHVRVFLNACPHRGNKVCFADVGTTRSFICNYHGWAFGLDGALRGMPEQALYEATPGFDMKDWGLKQARVESYKGLVFATFDETAPSLGDYLGDFRWYLDAVLDVEEGGTEFLPGSTRWTMKCNWKVAADNFAGDIYHALWTHLGGAKPTLDAYGGVKIDHENSYQVSVNGHGWEFGNNMIGNAATMGDRELLRYMKSRADSIAARLGDFRKNMWGAVSSATVFPNFSFLPGYFTFRTFQPKGPTGIEIMAWTLVPRNMPADIKDRFRRGAMRTFSPAGILETDDGENWENCTATNAGVVTRKQKLYYGLNPKGGDVEAGLPGDITRGQVSDVNQRAFYRRWAELMDGRTWADVPMAPSRMPVLEAAE